MSSVLIVAADPSARAAFGTLLGRAGYQVHEAATGGEALTRVGEVRPLAILLDVGLPDLDVSAACRALRADRQAAGSPVLLLADRDDDPAIVLGLEAGADDCVTKATAGEVILVRLGRLIRYRQLANLSVINEQLVQVGRLLAGIVHEIRGPLAVIRGNAELMRLHLGEGHAHLQWVEPILRNAQVLQVRLEHLMAAVRGGPAHFRALEVTPLIREAVQLFQKGSDPRDGQVAVDLELSGELPLVRADGGRLLQVLLNLLCNAREAILAARPAGRIAVRAGRDRDQDCDGVAIRVIDDGPGIAEDYLGRIFEPFFTTKATGTGYGLYLASEILREHGGRLTASNAPEGGACFTLWLPLATEPPTTAAS